MNTLEATNYSAHPRPYDALEMNCGWSVAGSFACADEHAPLCISNDREKFSGDAPNAAAVNYVNPMPQETQTPYVFYNPYFTEPAWIPSDATSAKKTCKESRLLN